MIIGKKKLNQLKGELNEERLINQTQKLYFQAQIHQLKTDLHKFQTESFSTQAELEQERSKNAVYVTALYLAMRSLNPIDPIHLFTRQEIRRLLDGIEEKTREEIKDVVI